jgi:hypothetical protein
MLTMTKDKSDSNQPSQAMTDFLREKATGESSGEIPASEEEVRMETAWSEMLARKRAKQSQTESGNDPDHHNPNDPSTGKGSGGRSP